MNCESYREHLTNAVDRHELVPADVSRHFETCSDAVCQQAWDDHRLLERALASYVPSSSGTLVARTLAQLSSEGVIETSVVRHSSPTGRSAWLGWIVAAGVMVSAGLALRTDRRPADGVVQSDPTKSPAIEPSTATKPSALSLPAHLAARAPALVTETMKSGFDRASLEDLPLVSPLVSVVSETLKPMSQEWKDLIEDLKSQPSDMDSTQLPPVPIPLS